MIKIIISLFISFQLIASEKICIIVYSFMNKRYFYKRVQDKDHRISVFTYDQNNIGISNIEKEKETFLRRVDSFLIKAPFQGPDLDNDVDDVQIFINAKSRTKLDGWNQIQNQEIIVDGIKSNSTILLSDDCLTF